MAKTSSFATHFALFGQNTRRQTQMAYQQAAQDIQQTQASQLAQREMLVQMLKGEQDYLRALRKDLRDLDKSFVNLNVDDGLRFKLTNAAAQLGNVYGSISKEDLSSIQKTEERLEKRFTIDPAVRSAINNWQRSIGEQSPITNIADNAEFNFKFGLDSTSPINKTWLSVQSAFNKLDNDDSKSVALESISNVFEKINNESRIGDVGITPFNTVVEESLSDGLSFNKRLTPEEANTKKQIELNEAESKLSPRANTANAVNKRLNLYLEELNTLGENNPEVQTRINTLKTNMDNLSEEIAASKKLVTGYRDKLQEAPAELPTVRERAGEILLEQDAAKAFAKQQKKAIKEQTNKNMRTAIEDQSSEDKELLKYLSLAPDFKQNDPAADNREDNFFRKWISSLEKNPENPGTIQSYYAKVNKQTGLTTKQKDDYKTAATKRMMDAVNKSQETVKDFDKGINNQEPVKKQKEVKPTVNTYTIKTGDTLSGISQEVGVSVQDLMKQNNIEKAGNIKAGAKIQWK
tara:strand:- start:2564 stop:4123 length:1560 start_codon:yes stop_codon:yes gene_type:complete